MQDVTQHLLRKQGTDRDEAIATWKESSRKAEEEARNLSESLKESRENKLFRKRKRTESMSNLPASKQAELHNPTLMEALT